MVNADLLKYITTQKSRGLKREDISNKLVSAGWNVADVEEGLEQVFSIVNEISQISDTQPSSGIASLKDKYREPVVKPVDSTPVYNPEVVSSMAQAWRKPEPLSADPKQPSFGGGTTFKIPPTIKEEFMPKIAPKPYSPASSMNNAPMNIPSSMPRVQSDGPVKIPETIPNIMFNDFKPASTQVPPSSAQVLTPNAYSTNPLSTITSSYKKDVTMMEMQMPQSSNSFKWVKPLIIVVLLFMIIGGGVFAYNKGLISALPFEIPFMTKSPQKVLAGVALAQSKVSSWKGEGEVKIEMPNYSGSFGTAPTKDTFLFTFNSLFNRAEDLQKNVSTKFNLITPYTSEAINSEFRALGGKEYLYIPKFSDPLLSLLFLESGWVSVEENSADSLMEYLPENLSSESLTQKRNALLSVAQQKQYTDVVMSVLEDAFTKIQITKNPNTNLKGVPVYHYSLILDKETIKHLMTKIFEVDKVLSAQQKEKALASIDDVSMSPVEVWVGTKDNLLYKFTTTMALSIPNLYFVPGGTIPEKDVIAFDLKGEFYDYNVPVTIEAPGTSMSMSSMVNGNSMTGDTLDTTLPSSPTNVEVVSVPAENPIDAENKKILINQFVPNTVAVMALEGGYGLKPNTTGSCKAPATGSLFNPYGHKEEAFNKMIETSANVFQLVLSTDSKAVCYSTLKTWAVAFPLVDKTGKWFCADNTGAQIEIDKPIKGPICK